MVINEKLDGDVLTVSLEGRLDTVTAPELETALKAHFENIHSLVFDLNDLEYTSSAGLRVFLASQKAMNKVGGMVIKNVKPEVLEIFTITGMIDVLHIE